jgi:hypothetical protein
MRIFTTFFFLALLMLLPSALWGQLIIKGVVQNEIKEPQANVQVVALDIEEGHIISFTTSREKGLFLLTITTLADSIDIEFSSLNLEKKKLRIPSKNQELTITLTSKIFELPEISIETTKPIILQKKDTLEYNVEDFTSQEDKVLSDILKKLPGIEVKPSGAIYYQDKPISNFYIEGLDLLRGRYTLASENLPAASVDKVQVLESHQEIRALQDARPTDKTALNIVLKNNTELTGTAYAGLGIPLPLWDVNITPILLRKNMQNLSSYQSNNTGRDASRQLKNLTFGMFGDLQQSTPTGKDWVEIPRLNIPMIPDERVIFNNQHQISTDQLIPLNKTDQFKLHASFINDNRRQFGGLNNTFILPDDTLRFSESISNQFKIRDYVLEITHISNQKHRYIENSLKTYRNERNERGETINDENHIAQEGNKLKEGISHELRYVKHVKKTVLEIITVNSFFNGTQNVDVNVDGPAPWVFEGGSARQDIIERKINSKSKIKWSRPFWRLDYNGFMEADLQWTTLNSTLNIAEVQTNDTLTNRVSSTFFQNKLSNSIVFRHKKFTSILSMPVSLVQVDNRNLWSETAAMTRYFGEPSLSLNYTINNYWRGGLRISKQNNLNPSREFFPGLIMRNYRDFQLQQLPFLESSSFSKSGNIHYKNPISSLFINMSFQQSQTWRNYLTVNELLPMGINSMLYKEEDNFRTTQTFSVNLSKKLSGLRSTVFLSFVTTQNEIEQLVNDNLVTLETLGNIAEFNVSSTVSRWMMISTGSQYSQYQTKFSTSTGGEIHNQKHDINLHVFPSKQHTLTLQQELFINQTPGQRVSTSFSNITYKYSPQRTRLEFFLTWANIFNNNQLSFFSNSTFQFSEQFYDLRPQQVLFKVNFRI